MCSMALIARLRKVLAHLAGARCRVERRLRLTLEVRNDLGGKQFR